MYLEAAQTLALALLRAARFAVSFPLPFGEQAHGAPLGAQPVGGVVVAQQQAVFAAAREHSVGLVGPLRDEVVYQNADVRLVAPEDEGRFAAHAQRRVDSRDEPLARRLLVARGSVYLSREE